MDVPFWFYFVTLLIDCTLPLPCRENGPPRNELDAASRLLTTLGYENRPKSVGDWKKAFAAAANERESLVNDWTLNASLARKDWQSNVTLMRHDWQSNVTLMRRDWSSNVSLIQRDWSTNTTLTRQQFERLYSVALRVALPTYECMKFELYEKVWNTGGPTSADFNATVMPPLIPDNSKSDYKKHHVAWNKILTGSKDLGAIAFVKALKNALGKDYNAEVVSRNIALTIVILQNNKHEPSAKEAGLEFLSDPVLFVNVLSTWKCLEDPRLLQIVELFERVTTGTLLQEVTTSTLPPNIIRE